MRGYVATVIGGAVGIAIDCFVAVYLGATVLSAALACYPPMSSEGAPSTAAHPCGPTERAIAALGGSWVAWLVVAACLVAVASLSVGVAVRTARAGAARETAVVAAAWALLQPLLGWAVYLVFTVLGLADEPTMALLLLVWLVVALGTLPTVRRSGVQWNERRTRGGPGSTDPSDQAPTAA
jgi:hypothetical protein